MDLYGGWPVGPYDPPEQGPPQLIRQRGRRRYHLVCYPNGYCELARVGRRLFDPPWKRCTIPRDDQRRG